tara:strand:- start:26 stop:484 length:459 start_codon:yes stop_codon:yes gene_type:complete
MNEYEEDDMEHYDNFEIIQSNIDECHRRMDAICDYLEQKFMKMILDLDYTDCSDRYRSEEMIQADSMFLNSISLRQNMFAELINYLIKHLDLDSEERVVNIEENYLKEEKNEFDIANLKMEEIDSIYKDELSKRKDFIDEFSKIVIKDDAGL